MLVTKFKKRSRKHLSQVFDLIQLGWFLLLPDGKLKPDILPSLKRINPSIESVERFLSTVIKFS